MQKSVEDEMNGTCRPMAIRTCYADYYSADHLRQVATVALKSAHELAEAVLMYCRGLSTEPVIGFIG